MRSSPASETVACAALAQVYKTTSVRITQHIQAQIDQSAAAEIFRLQYVPDAREAAIRPDEDGDPTGDAPHSPVPGLVHRYPDRVLLMPTQKCAVYCRFCFRKSRVGPGHDDADLDAAFTYIEQHSEIREVILTGGDPLILSPRRLKTLLDRLDTVPHLQFLRIHSRVPVADPPRVTDELCRVLQTQKPLYLSVHINHAAELTGEAQAVLKRLHDCGVVLLSQTVLLRGVNDTADALESLFTTLTAHRVRPYYLHHLDRAPGTAHFRVPLEEGQKLYAALRGRISGLCIPHYVLDIPGGHGKVPVGVCAAHREEEGYRLEDRFGDRHLYVEKDE